MTDIDNINDIQLSRRSLLRGAGTFLGAAALAAPLSALAANPAAAAGRGGWHAGLAGGYGPLYPTKDLTTGQELLKLPRGFQYMSFGRSGELMTDGIATPGNHDGMAAFRMPDGKVHLVRNHERGPGAAFAHGMTYNDQAGGGTTTLVFDPDKGQLVESWASLAGTIRNCAGGPTPWGSWLTCEETIDAVGAKRHGYVFEVPADGVGSGQPIIGMGRYNHEAAAVDPATHIVYLTEDATPSGLYRYVPTKKDDLAAGGKLQMLKIGDGLSVSTYIDATGKSYGKVSWVDIDDPDPSNARATAAGSVVQQGILKGGAVFSRGEGAWYSNGKVHFVSTNGGPARQGQIFELDVVNDTLRVLYASPDAATLNAPDNICASPRGGLVICEDGSGTEFLHGLGLDGKIFPFAENNLNDSEWAGATFEPKNGNWLFANIQSPGITFAITGPWRQGVL
ncbi:MAG TPA: alkaline phosphatase PhoX [Acidimicrobiales bacterium]|jgi:uncharacterized protein|nr:alkaline phosphatase PhoX [Acidimicrobiales bacterium]